MAKLVMKFVYAGASALPVFFRASEEPSPPGAPTDKRLE